MYVKRYYGFWKMLHWSIRPLLWALLYSLALSGLAYFLEIVIALPWQPVSIIGIAVAFYLGFKNSSSYDRSWEARKIWGGIVNNSRAFGASVLAFVKGENQKEIRTELIYRHLAWITALRHQLRLARTWEHTETRIKDKFSPVVCENYYTKLDTELLKWISDGEKEALEKTSNRAVQLLKTQSVRLQDLCENEYFEDFRHMEFHKLVTSFYADQGKTERIKNFPFPRQFASAALWLTFVFAAFVPLGMNDIFKNVEGLAFWVGPLLSSLIIWTFFLMESIGDYSENPFEGSYNDVPISSISRGIEIDLLEMLDEKDIPQPLTADEAGFLL